MNSAEISNDGFCIIKIMNDALQMEEPLWKQNTLLSEVRFEKQFYVSFRLLFERFLTDFGPLFDNVIFRSSV